MEQRNSKGQFVKGIVPWNTGLKGVNGYNANKTSFKSGKEHPKYKPIGSERIDKDGLLVVKVADRKWMPKQKYLWEKENGPVPRGHVVIFGNRNKRDFRSVNLILVSRKQLATINKLGFIFDDEELSRTGIILSDLIQKKTELIKSRKGAEE